MSYVLPHLRRRQAAPPAASASASQPASVAMDSAPPTPAASTTSPPTNTGSATSSAPSPSPTPATVNPPSSFASEKFAAKREPGTAGTPVTTLVNFYTVAIPNVDTIQIYSISLAPTKHGKEIKDRAAKKVRIELLLQHPEFHEHARHLASDFNSILISTSDLQLPDRATVTLPAQGGAAPDRCNISIRHSHTLHKEHLGSFVKRNAPDLDEYWMTSLNILARKHGTPASVQVGAHKLFPANAQHTDLHHGLHARRGYFNSMRPVERNVVLNMHGVTAAFINEQPLHHYPQAFLPKFSGYLADAQFRACDGAFKAIIRGLRVRRLYTPLILTGASRSRILVQPDLSSKIMRITGFGSSAASQTFHHSDYGLISVKNYFNGHVLATTSPLKHPHLLVCNLGTFDRPNFVPSELLYIVADQPFLGQLPEGAMGPMVKVSQRLPKENVELIDDAFKDGSIFSRGDLLENGIKVGEKMMEPKARVLPIPDLMYGSSYRLRGGKQKSTLRNGKWDLRGKRFRVSGSMGMLGIIEVGNTPGRSTTPTYEKFAKDLTGYGISGTHSINVVQAQTSAPAILDTALASMKQRLAFNLVMLPGNDSFTYDAIKWWGDTQAGVHTISITPEKATKLGDAGIRANLVSKFNIKAGGHNHVHIEEAIREMQHGGTTIVLGADVSHPDSSSVQHCPSIAAVVSSVDKFAVNFPGSLRLQIAKQEKITDLKEMVRERITVWLLHNDNKLPTNVIFYRDGVSESQMTMVRDHDLAEIRAAFHAEGIKAGDATYDPKITLIVCGKRHHTRFYPTEKAKKANGWAIDNNGNWLAGLVVDDPTIRNPYHYDFYLQSHVALKGTARPCHYFVVHNDMELTSDEIQRITFNLCWTYPISLTPISYASPAYCADVLAERGRSYLTPFIKGGHPVRTSIDANLMEGIQQKLPTKEKDERVLEKIKAGWTPPDFPNMPHWVSVATRSNPQHPDLGETMFYV